jgi:hypothetical protein
MTRNTSATRVTDRNTPEPQNTDRNPPAIKVINAQTILAKTYGKELANLAKLYTNKYKYSGKNDNFDFKLIIFIDLY